MSRYYEEKLPEGYSEALVIDANDKKQGMRFQLAAMVAVVVMITLLFFLYARPRLDEIAAGFNLIKCFAFAFAYLLNIVLHELTHGLVYKLLTKRKLTIGFRLTSAYCGVPDVYTYRITSMTSLFAPFTVFGVIYTSLFFIINDPFSKMMLLVLLTFHISGCVGDLYGAGLYLFRFKSPSTLRRDFGPKQVYYTKDRL